MINALFTVAFSAGKEEDTPNIATLCFNLILGCLGIGFSCFGTAWFIIYMVAYAQEIPDCLDEDNDVVFDEAYPFLKAIFGIQMAPFACAGCMCVFMLCCLPCLIAGGAMAAVSREEKY